MGDYADMMLDGTCCCSCGEFLDNDDSCGPSYCAGCNPESENIFSSPKPKKVKQKKTVRCLQADCARKFVNMDAMKQHAQHFHKIKGVWNLNRVKL